MSFQTLEAVASRTRVVRVNLLPAGFDKPRKDRRLRVALGAGVLAVVGVVGVGYSITLDHVGEADDRLSAAQARTAELQAAQVPYAEVPKVLAEVKAAQDVKAQVSQPDVTYYALLDRLAAVTPADLSMTTVSFTSGQAAGAAAATAPAATSAGQSTGPGTVTFSGKTMSVDTVAQWMDNVATVRGLADPQVGNATRGDDGVVTFSATAKLTDDALSSNQ